MIREVRGQDVNTRQPPASTAVEVRRLFREDALIEVDADGRLTRIVGFFGEPPKRQR